MKSVSGKAAAMVLRVFVQPSVSLGTLPEAPICGSPANMKEKDSPSPMLPVAKP